MAKRLGKTPRSYEVLQVINSLAKNDTISQLKGFWGTPHLDWQGGPIGPPVAPRAHIESHWPGQITLGRLVQTRQTSTDGPSSLLVPFLAPLGLPRECSCKSWPFACQAPHDETALPSGPLISIKDGASLGFSTVRKKLWHKVTM